MSDPSSQPTQPLTEAEPYEDTFMVSHQQTALGEHELDKIRAYFKEQIRPGGDLSDPDGTMARIWMGRLLADAGLSRQMLARAEAEVSRLRAENTAQAEQLEMLLPIARPRWKSKQQRESYREGAAWQNLQYHLVQAEAAEKRWKREADWLRVARDERKAAKEAGTWPPALGLDQDGRGQ